VRTAVTRGTAKEKELESLLARKAERALRPLSLRICDMCRIGAAKNAFYTNSR